MIKTIIISAIFVFVILKVESKYVKNVFENKECGFKACHWTNPDPYVINVHLVPHSHDDVGWLKTVDQYYYGLRKDIQFAGVQHIIGSVVEALHGNPDRRFIQVETAFFWQWWKKQSEFKRDVVRKLVNNGQLEMVNGAWSMNDEAATNYQSIIDQFTLGLRKISDTVGECGRPNIGWQIDPFGHSGEMASLFSQFGYEAVFFARLDYRDSVKRHHTRNMEFMWQGSRNLGSASNIFTSVLYDFYTAPRYFCWDVVCGDAQIVDDLESPYFNQNHLVSMFANYVLNATRYFKSNNILITMGGDFTYQAAGMYFTNMDKLIEGFKKYRPDINIIYSTPACYLKSVNEASKISNIQYDLNVDDFFPYASGENSYWTGYFTSRPNSKRFEREGNNLLQATKHLMSLNHFNQPDDFIKDLDLLKEIMGIMQHHDAITGTEKQHVADDYVRLLTKATKEATWNMGIIIASLLDKRPGQYLGDVTVPLHNCLLTNISHCVESTLKRFVIVLYNPLSKSRSHYVRLPVDSEHFEINGPAGKVLYDIAPQIMDFKHLTPWIQPNELELVFKANKIPPLGIQYFIIEKVDSSKYKFMRKMRDNRQTRFGNSNAGFEIDPETGLLSSVTIGGYNVAVKQEFLYYYGAGGHNQGEYDRASGAYIFRPAKDTLQAINCAHEVKWKSYERGQFDEVYQEFNNWIKQIIRVYRDSDHIEFDWLVGPIPVSNQSMEIITRFTTNLNNGNIFYTDSNGREMVKRVRNQRETYNYTSEEPVAGNYYPVTSRIMIEDLDQSMQFAILNDRAQGGTSLRNGEVELMVHRRMLNDDNFGVREPLNEYEFTKGVRVRGKHYLTFGISDLLNGDVHPSAVQRILAQEKLLAPWAFLGNLTDPYFNIENIKNKLHLQFTGLNEDLPENLQILTLEPWNADSMLLRLEHTIELYKNEPYSNGVTIQLKNLFSTFRVIGIKETTLGGNQWLAENTKLTWNISSQNQQSSQSKYRGQENSRLLDVTLYPMEIRTFIIDIERY